MEIDIFIAKFKELLLSGRNATLEIKAVAGKAELNLHVELMMSPKSLASKDGPAVDPLDKGEGLEELLNVKLPKQILRMILLLKKLGEIL